MFVVKCLIGLVCIDICGHAWRMGGVVMEIIVIGMRDGRFCWALDVCAFERGGGGGGGGGLEVGTIPVKK